MFCKHCGKQIKDDSKSWYFGTIEADDFIETKYLSEIEINNMYFIADYENGNY